MLILLKSLHKLIQRRIQNTSLHHLIHMNLCKEELVGLHHTQELTLAEIAANYSIPVRVLSAEFDRLGIEKRKFYKSKRKNKPITQAEFIWDYLVQQLPLSELFEKWNLSETSFNRLLTQFQLDHRPRVAHNKTEFNHYSLEKVTRLFKDLSKSIAEIAKELGCSTPTVKKILIHFGLVGKNESITQARYGQKSTIGTPLFVNKTTETCLKKYSWIRPQTFTHRSKVEKNLESWLIETFPEVEITHTNRSILSGKEIDILIPDYRLAIEMNGCYAHSEEANPNTKELHAWKHQECLKQGIHLLTIWDEEWKQKPTIIQSIIRCKLGKSNRIPGRKCSLVQVDSHTASSFYDENHIQGTPSLSGLLINLGLEFQGDLVGLMSFGLHHRTARTWILSRCCFKVNHIVLGGTEKLFSQFTTTWNYPLTSWSDNRWFSGVMYPKLGFKEGLSLPPDYCYWTEKMGIKPKQSYQKKKFIELGGVGTTERELAKSLRFFRLWDCGKRTWYFDP